MARPPKTTRLKALATYKLLAARARVVLGTTKVQGSTVNALARLAAMAAVGKAATISASVKASLLIAGAETGRFFTLLNAEDRFTASEIRNFNMTKLRVDEIQSVDRALAEVFKVLADAARTSEQVDRLVGKSRADAAVTTDLTTRDSRKLLTDAVPTTDLAAKGFSATRQDTTTTEDSKIAEVGKRVTDTAITADLLDRTVAFVRFFEDVTDATDEINANLLMDDGQVVFISKAVRDVATTSIQTTFGMARVQADTATTGDDSKLVDFRRVSFDSVAGSTQLAYDIVKAQADTATTGDSDKTVAFGKANSDAVPTSTQLAYDIARVQSDAALTGDSRSVDSEKTLGSNFGTSDASVVAVGARRSDSVVSSEQTRFATGVSRTDAAATDARTTFELHKHLYDYVTTSDTVGLFFEAYYENGVVTSEDVQAVRIAANGVPAQLERQTVVDVATIGFSRRFDETIRVSDDFDGTTTAEDDQTSLVGKNILHNVLTSELRQTALRRTLQESASVGSNGLLAMTDYCDSTYFSQAYVGTERIFS